MLTIYYQCVNYVVTTKDTQTFVLKKRDLKSINSNIPLLLALQFSKYLGWVDDIARKITHSTVASFLRGNMYLKTTIILYIPIWEHMYL